LKNALGFCYKEWVFERKELEKQGEFWVETRRLPKLSAGGFFRKVEEVLAEIGFAEEVHRLCRPAYSQRSDGRPGIDPVVYFKMLMVGFFESLPTERAIAARCEDSLAVRAFLGYRLDEATPDRLQFERDSASSASRGLSSRLRANFKGAKRVRLTQGPSGGHR